MNLLQAKQAIVNSAFTGWGRILISPSGIGKSHICWQAAQTIQQMEPNVRWGYGVIFAATQTPSDIIGYQFKGEKVFEINGERKAICITEPSCPLWMIGVPVSDPNGEPRPAWLFDKFFLVIDEYGQGEPDTKRSLAEVMLNGGTSPWYLPPGSMRVACTNEGSRYGVTKDFDFAITRRSEIRIHGDASITADHLDKPYTYQGRVWQTLPVVKTWMRTPEGATALFEKEPEKQGPWCNPRSACAADRELQVLSNFGKDKLPVDDPFCIELLAGTMGMPATQSLVKQIKYALELPRYSEIVADPQNTPVPVKADLMMLMAYELANNAQPDDMPQCLAYMKRLQKKDLEVTFATALMRRDYNSFVNTPAFVAWCNQNAAIVALMASLR